MKKYFTKKNILYSLLGIFVIIQFIRIDKTNPAIDSSKDFINITAPSSEISQLLKSTCYDCHSHESTYPWYTNIAPLSFWIKSHITEGREHVNFSTWGDYSNKRKNHSLEESAEMMEKKWMPLLTYKIAHSEARLSDEQYLMLKEFFENEMRK